MTKFILTYHAPAAAMSKMATATPEEKAAGMKPWMDWKAEMGDTVIDFGAPLGGGTIVHSSGQTEACTREITGYSIISANDLNHAKSLISNHPHLSWGEGCTIGVHEFVAM